jgi:hypothetical protein
MHDELKQRPLYLVRDERGFSRSDRPSTES